MGDTGASGAIGFLLILAIFALTAVVTILFFVSLTKNCGKHSGLISIISSIILIPLACISMPIAIKMAKDQARRNIEDSEHRCIAWAYMGDDVNSLIDDFYKKHPEAFTFPNDKEAPYSPALMQFLVSQDAFIKSGFTVRDGGLVSPFGDNILFAIDANGDGLIITMNYVCASPWKDKRYSCALIRFTTKEEISRSPLWVRQN